MSNIQGFLSVTPVKSHGAVVSRLDDCYFALSLVTDGGTKLVPIGQHFTKQDKFELFEATKNSLWKGTEKALLLNGTLFGRNQLGV